MLKPTHPHSLHALAPRYFLRPTACAAADPRDWVAQGGKDEDALKAAIALSQLATHPISECVVGLRDALPRGSLLPHVSDFQLRPGGPSYMLQGRWEVVWRVWLLVSILAGWAQLHASVSLGLY